MLKACDMASELTLKRASELLSMNIIAVGLYTKYLTLQQVSVARANRMGIFVINEGRGDAATFAAGAAQGRFDGQKAAGALQNLGFPSITPIFSAVDFDASAANVAQVLAYEAGFSIGCAPYPQGLYANGLVLSAEPAGTYTFLAAAPAWEGSKAYIAAGKATLVQHFTITLSDGTEIDPVDCYNEKVVWFPGGRAEGSVNPTTRHLPALSQLQTWANADGFSMPIDGVWGNLTAEGLRKAYNG